MVTVTIKEKLKELKFPKLMKGTESSAVVLFTESKKGTVLSMGRSDNNVGWYYSNWQMDFFKDFKEELTLKNKQ
mgnify:CR=1 FL=1